MGIVCALLMNGKKLNSFIRIDFFLWQSINHNVAFKVVFVQFAQCRNHLAMTCNTYHVLSLVAIFFLTVQVWGCLSDILMIFNEVLNMSNSKNYALLFQIMITVLGIIILFKQLPYTLTHTIQHFDYETSFFNFSTFLKTDQQRDRHTCQLNYLYRRLQSSKNKLRPLESMVHITIITKHHILIFQNFLKTDQQTNRPTDRQTKSPIKTPPVV